MTLLSILKTNLLAQIPVVYTKHPPSPSVKPLGCESISSRTCA
jgi:hypothetical protein